MKPGRAKKGMIGFDQVSFPADRASLKIYPLRME